MNAAAPERLEIVEDLRSTVRAAVAAVEPGSGDAILWRRLTDQVGIAGLLVPEAQSGLELGAVEAAAVAREIGAAAANLPFLSHVVAATVLLRVGLDLNGGSHERAQELLSTAATGERRLGVAWNRPGADSPVLSASTRLSGAITGVLDAAGADAFLVESELDGAPAVCLVETCSQVTASEQSVLDPSRSVGTLTLVDAPCTVLLTGDTARRALDVSKQWTLLAIAADQVGIARRSLDLTVDYVSLRTQFGAVIGSFQAVKHRCADVLLELELASAMVDQAAAALDDGDDPSALVSTAALQATTAAITATEALIHLHGGIGFTWEHVAHHYFRRARSNASLLGPVQELRDAVAAASGL